MAQEDLFKKIVAHAKEYGFVFPSSEIYDGLSAVYDYGQNGVELKNNIKRYWWDAMTQLNENIVGLDSAIFMHPTIWKASGHVDAFNDPLIDNRDSKKRYRADVLIEDEIAKFDDKINKEVAKAAKKFGEGFDEKLYRETNPRVLEHTAKRNELHERYAKAMNDMNLEELRQIILDYGIVCPISGTKNWTEVRQFNLMFSTEMGSTADGSMRVYLRPETAQGIFVNFLNVQKTGRMRIPFGIAQIGKAFRNEIVARQFIFRMREFEQMEMQFFVRPGDELEWFKKWKEIRLKWHKALGLGDEKYRYHDHEKLAHYANAATDIEFLMPFGFKEVEGIHSRTNFDLSNHEKCSGKKIEYFDPELNQSYVPYVIETSIGVDRMFLSVYAYYQLFTDVQIHTNWYALLIPVLVMMLAGLALGFGILFSSMTTKYRDLQLLLSFFVSLWMYATPVIYPLSTISNPKLLLLMQLNPLTGIIEFFKYGMLGVGCHEWWMLGYSFAFMLVLLSIGIVVFNKVQRSFMDTV